MMAMDLSKAVITKHAQSQMERRQISEQDLRQLLDSPDEIFPVRTGLVVVQGMIGDYLLRSVCRCGSPSARSGNELQN
jgi:hypothetical protein